MTESHVISSLVAKRAEIARQIESYQTEISRLQSTINFLDGSIKLFAPDYDLRTLKDKRATSATSIWNTRNQYLEHGEGQRLTLGILRVEGTCAAVKSPIK